MKQQDTSESLRMALSTLRAHKFRSFLTVLGVVIGTVTVMVIAAFIAGLDKKFQQDIEVFGTNTIFIYKFNPGIHVGRLSPEERMRKPITYEDAVAIKENCPSVKYVAPFLSPDDVATVRYQNEELYITQVQGTLPEYDRMASVQVSEGRFFSESENQHRADVCVIGADIADKFFPHVAALGKEILVNEKPFTVIGVLEKQESFFMSENDGGNQNRAVYVPYEAMHKMYPAEKDHFVMAQAHEGKMVAAQDEIRHLLRRRREVPFNKDDNFGMSTPEAITDQFRQITGGIAMLMFAFSSVGLLIGGIGVMNIMLVSVTERTKEIGVRKAIGARRRDIMIQFLIEAMALTGSGGLLGILIGW
ncbi:MAG TPA: ABC transporter permease, partial [Blastocatellia bacterium]|nr:ABC transporter permease [Blastocatellia bacterium]